MKNLVRIGVLVMGASLAAGCGGSTATPAANTVTPAVPLSISGTLASSTMRVSDYFGEKLSSSGFTANAVTLADLIVSCVTFSVPPVAGQGGDVGADGKFTVTFADGARGKNFGCFITAVDPDFAPIPMVFVDSTKKSMNGSAAQSSRLAVTDDITMPSIALNLEENTATIDVATIESTNTPTETGADVIAVASGTKIDFTGEWTIADPVAEGIALPAGYRGPMTYADVMQDDKGGGGPLKGMHLYMQRMIGKDFLVTDPTACNAAQATEHDASVLIAGDCAGTTAADDMYGIQLWGPNMDALFTSGPPADEATFNSVIAAASAEASFNACKRYLGFTSDEAKVFGGFDITADPNFVSEAGGGTTSGKYYNGKFEFATSLDMTADVAHRADVFGGEGKPLKLVDGLYTSDLTEGWKFAKAQLRWSGQNCESATITIGGKEFPSWRCYGKYSAAHVADPTTGFNAIPVNAYRAQLGGGCYVVGTGKPIGLGNWTDFWGTDPATFPTYTNLTQFGGVNLPEGMWGGRYVKENFMPKACQGAECENLLPAAVTVACENFEGFYNLDHTVLANTADEHWKGDMNHFKYDAMGTTGTLCSDLASGTDAQKLKQLRCYAEAYWDPARYLTGCLRDVQFNFNAQNPWEFLEQNGPEKTRTRFIMEKFNYSSNDSGSFTNVSEWSSGFEAQDAAGMQKWINCRVRENLSISITAVAGNPNKLLADFTSVMTLADTWNTACAAEAAKGLDGELRLGTTKMMFVMNKQ